MDFGCELAKAATVEEVRTLTQACLPVGTLEGQVVEFFATNKALHWATPKEIDASVKVGRLFKRKIFIQVHLDAGRVAAVEVGPVVDAL